MNWFEILLVVFVVVGILYFAFIGFNVIANIVALSVLILFPSFFFGVGWGLTDPRALNKWWAMLICLVFGAIYSLAIIFAGPTLNESSSTGDDGKVIVVKDFGCLLVAGMDFMCWLYVVAYFTSLITSFFALFSR